MKTNLLKVVINKVSDFIEKHNMPEPIRRGVHEIMDSIKQKQPSRGAHR